jgi:hypothetical protein
LLEAVLNKVARLYIFIPKIPFCVTYFGGPWNGKYRYVLCPLGMDMDI